MKEAVPKMSQRRPPGWVQATLGEIASVRSGFGFPIQMQGQSEGEIPFAKVSDISKAVEQGSKYLISAANCISEKEAQALRAHTLPKGAVVFAKIGGAIELNRRALLKSPFIVDNNVMGIIPEPEIESLFLYFFMLTQRLGTISRATTVPSLRKSDVESIPILVPPTNEQRRIVEALDELLSDLDAGIVALRRAQTRLKHYRAAVLKAAVEGRLTAEWRKQNSAAESAPDLLKRILVERRRLWEEEQLRRFEEKGKEPSHGWQSGYPKATAPDTSSFPKLPSEWCCVTLDQIAEIQGGLQKTPARTPIANHHPYLRVANVQRGRLDLKELSRFELTEQELRQLTLKRGDLLIVEGNGSRTEIGRCAIWRGEIKNCVHQNHIIRVRLLAGVVAEYVDIFLNSPLGQRVIQNVASSTSGLHTLSISKIARLTLPMPTFTEQQAIVDVAAEQISMIDRVQADIEAKLAAAKALRQSILHRAFTGQLVPHDPNDEPAEEILNRVAAARARRTIKKSRRRAEIA